MSTARHLTQGRLLPNMSPSVTHLRDMDEPFRDVLLDRSRATAQIAGDPV
jgi:hypothetical protein